MAHFYDASNATGLQPFGLIMPLDIPVPLIHLNPNRIVRAQKLRAQIADLKEYRKENTIGVKNLRKIGNLKV